MSDVMAEPGGREALRGAEAHIFNLMFEALTSQQWAELLRAPLELAAAKGERGLAQQLVRAGAEIGYALHEAAGGGHGEIVNDLLGVGASIDGKGGDGCTPLHTAAGRGKTEIAQLLLLEGANKDAFDNERHTPLCLAVYRGHVAVALVLLTAGADIRLSSGQTHPPLMHVVAENGPVEILRAFIEHGAAVDAVDSNDATALQATAYYDNAESVHVLVGAGANIEARDCDGRTPLHCACMGLSCGALLALLKLGANINSRTEYLQTPLMSAVRQAGNQGAAEVVDALLRAGADETIVDYGGRKASGMIAADVLEVNRLLEDVLLVRELLANAPADRAWRRRGYLVLCRAHPDRTQQIQQVISGSHHTDTIRRTGSGAEPARAQSLARDSNVDARSGGDWTVVVAKVLQLQEEGIFRTIVDYL